MADLLVPADAEQAVIDELAPFYAIATIIPEQKPATFLRVVSAGGYNRDLITDTPLLVLEAFAQLESDAGRTLNEAIARLQYAVQARAKIGGIPAYGLIVSGLPQNYPLSTVPSHKRYTSTIEPALRRRVITA